MEALNKQEKTTEELLKDLEQAYKELGKAEQPFINIQTSINTTYQEKLNEYNRLVKEQEKLDNRPLVAKWWSAFKGLFQTEGITTHERMSYDKGFLENLLSGNFKEASYVSSNYGEQFLSGFKNKVTDFLDTLAISRDGFNTKITFKDLQTLRNLQNAGLVSSSDQYTRWKKDVENTPQANGLIEQTFQAVGGMIPQVALSFMGGAGAISLSFMGLSAFGGSAREAYLRGKTNDETLLYAGLNAGVAMLTEQISNVGPMAKIYGKGLIQRIGGQKAAQKASEAITKTFTRELLEAMVSEGIEEGVEAFLEPIIENLSFGYEDKWYKDGMLTEEHFTSIMENFIVGAMASAMLSGANIAFNNATPYQRRNNSANTFYTQFQAFNQYSGLQGLEQTVDGTKIINSWNDTLRNVENEVNKIKTIDGKNKFLVRSELNNFMIINNDTGMVSFKDDLKFWFSTDINAKGKTIIVTPNYTYGVQDLELVTGKLYTDKLNADLESVKQDLTRNGVPFAFVEADNSVNAYLQDGVIVLNINNTENAVKTAFVHEMTHKLKLDLDTDVWAIIQERANDDVEFKKVVDEITEKVNKEYQTEAFLYINEEIREKLYKSEVVAHILENDIAYDFVINLLEKKPNSFRKLYNFISHKIDLKNATTKEAKAQIKYLHELRKKFQQAINNSGSVVNFLHEDIELFKQKYFEVKDGELYYTHPNNELEKVFVFKGGEIVKADTFMDAVDKLAKQDYFDRRNKRIAFTQAVDNSRGGIMSRINSADKDIIFGKFNIDTGNIESGVRYSWKTDREVMFTKSMNAFKEAQLNEDGSLNIDTIDSNFKEDIRKELEKVATIRENVFIPLLKNIETELQKLGNFKVPTGDFNSKSLSSVLSKLYREIHNKGKRFLLTDAKDLLRAYIEMPSYSLSDFGKVFNVLNKVIETTYNGVENNLKYQIDVKYNPNNNYRGFHILLNVDGITTEIQLHTKKTWEVKDKQEEIYTKWRNIKPEILTEKQKADYSADLEKSIQIGMEIDEYFNNAFLQELISRKATLSSMSTAQVNKSKSMFFLDQDFDLKSYLSASNNVEVLDNGTRKIMLPSSSNIYLYLTDTNTTPSNDSLQQKKSKSNTGNVRFSRKLNKQTPNAKNFIDAVAKVLEPELSIESGIWDRIEKEVINNFALTNMRPDKQQLWNAFYEFRDEIENIAKYGRTADLELKQDLEQNLINKIADKLLDGLVYDTFENREAQLKPKKELKEIFKQYYKKIDFGVEAQEIKNYYESKYGAISMLWSKADKNGLLGIDEVIQELAEQYPAYFGKMLESNNKALDFLELYYKNNAEIKDLKKVEYKKVSQELHHTDMEVFKNALRNNLKPILTKYIENMPLIKMYELIPYTVEAEFFETNADGSVEFKWNELRQTINSRATTLFNETDFIFSEELNTNTNDVARLNNLAHNLLDSTIKDILNKYDIDMELSDFIAENQDHYKSLRDYVRKEFLRRKNEIKNTIINDTTNKIWAIDKTIETQRSKAKYTYTHPEQVVIILDMLSSFRDGFITGNPKKINFDNARNIARELLKPINVDIVDSSGETKTIEVPKIRRFSPDLEYETPLEIGLKELVKSSGDMTLRELNILNNVVTTLKGRLSAEVEIKLGKQETIRTVQDLVYQGVSESEKLIRINWNSLRGKGLDLINRYASATMSPYNVFDLFSLGEGSIFKEFWWEVDNAINEDIRINNNADDILTFFLADKDIENLTNDEKRALQKDYDKWYKNRLNTINISDGNIDLEISKIQAISLLMTYYRPTARKHLLNYVRDENGIYYDLYSKSDELRQLKRKRRKDGNPIGNYGEYGKITLADYSLFKDTKRALENGKEVFISEKLILNIENALTDADFKYMEALRKVYDMSAELINQAYMERLGFPFLAEENYFPMYVNSNELATLLGYAKPERYNFETKNPTFLKKLSPTANQSLVMLDATDIVHKYIKQLANWKAWYIPLYKINRIYNAKIDVENQNGIVVERKSLKETLAKVNPRLDKWLSNYFEDVKSFGSMPDNALSQIIRFIRSKGITATFGLNPSIIFTQFTSLIASGQSGYNIPRVLVNFFKSIPNTVETQKLLDMIREHSPILYDRITDGGVYTGETRRAEKQTALTKLGSALTSGIHYVDGRIVLATFRTALEMFNGDIKQAVEFTEKNLMTTQANWHPALRPQFTRYRSELAQLYTLFMSEAFVFPSQILTNVFNKIKYKALANDMSLTADERAKYRQMYNDLKGDGIRIGATMTAQMLFLAFIQTFWRAFKHYKSDDGDEKEYWEMYLEELGAEIIGLFPLVKEIYPAITDNRAYQNFDTALLNRFGTATKNIYDVLGTLAESAREKKWLWDKTDRRKLVDGITEIGTMFGLPLRNLKIYIRGLIHTISDDAGYVFDDWFYANYYNSDFQKAIADKDTKMANTIINRVSNSDKLNKEIIRLNNGGYQVFPQVIPSRISYLGESYEVLATDRQELKDDYSTFYQESEKMLSLAHYKNLKDNEKQKALQTMSNYYYSKAKDNLYGGNTVEKTEKVLKVIDIKLLSIIVGKVSSMVSDRSGTKKQKVLAYLNTLGLNEYQKKEILEYLGYKVELKDVITSKKEPIFKPYQNSPTKKISNTYLNELKRQIGL